MDQPLDLSISNTEMIKNKNFTIEYLTSNIPHKSRSAFFLSNQTIPPLHRVENHLNHEYLCFNEHVVPNISSPPLTVSIKKNRNLQICILLY
jgi:hypothetical protein